MLNFETSQWMHPIKRALKFLLLSILLECLMMKSVSKKGLLIIRSFKDINRYHIVDYICKCGDMIQASDVILNDRHHGEVAKTSVYLDELNKGN